MTGLDDWPRSWRVDPADIPVGQQIVHVLTPFLLHLLDQGLAKATLRRHRDTLWTLGGELIRCRYDDDELASKHVKDALRQLIAIVDTHFSAIKIVDTHIIAL